MGAKHSAESTKDPDDVWSNMYREKETNSIYRWAEPDGDLVKIFESQGEGGVLRFADEKIKPLLFPDGPRVIGLSEYTMWKKQQETTLGLNEGHGSHLESRFKKHDALWRLNKRGIDGETLVHLLLHNEDAMCHEVARILIKRYPALSGDVYLGDEYFGQTALHLAIINDDHETVQLLLKNGADVNARACGTFFMPETWQTKKKVGSYKGVAYFGEYPLAFAACLGNRDLYDLLLDYHADPNHQDSFGNTVLHMCVISNSISMYSYAVRNRKKRADPLMKNYEGSTPLTLASQLGRMEIFEQMLELSKVEFWRFSVMAFSAYPIAALDSINIDGSTNYDSALLTIINGRTEEHLDMVGTDVVQRMLTYKWDSFAQWALYRRMFVLILHLFTLSIAAGLRPTELDRLYFMSENSSEFLHTGRPETSGSFGPRYDDWIRLVCEIVCYFLCIYFFVLQTREINAQGAKSYIVNSMSTPAKIVYSIANILLLLCLPCRILCWYEVEECLLVLGVPGAFFYALFFARSFQLTGPFVQIFYSMIKGDLALFLIISSIFMFPFCFSLHFLGKDIDAKDQLPEGNLYRCKRDEFTVYYSWSNPLEAFITLLRANLKGFDYEELDCHNYEYFAKALMLLYLLAMAVMMMAILIAMLANTYTKVIDRAEKAWRKQTAMIIMNLERSLSKKSLARHIDNYSITLHEATTERGLLVIKRTKLSKTGARQAAQRLWQRLLKKVREVIVRLGVDMATEALHDFQNGGFQELERLERPHSRKLETRHGGIASVVAEIMEAKERTSPRTSIDPSTPPKFSRSPSPPHPPSSSKVSICGVMPRILSARPHTAVPNRDKDDWTVRATPVGPRRQRGVSFATIEAPNLPPQTIETIRRSNTSHSRHS